MTANPSRLRQRFDADPSDRAAFESLEETYFVAGESAELIALYDAHLAACAETRPPGERARLLFRLGQAIEESDGDTERAADAFRAAVELDAQFAPALRRVRTLSIGLGNFDAAIETALAEGAAASETVRSLVEIGERALAEEQVQTATRAFEEALARAPRDARALVGVARALERSGRLHQAVTAWERASDALEGPARHTAIEALGALHAGPLADPEGALQLFQRACDDEPGEPRWLDELFALLVQLKRLEAAAALGPKRFERATDPRRRAAIALEIGRLHLDALNAPGVARSWLERAVEGSDDGAAHLALAEAAGRSGDSGGRLMYLERAMELGAEIPLWSDLGLEGGPDPVASLEALRRTAIERPEDPDALDALSAALAARGEHAERVGVLARRAGLARSEPAERAELWLEIGEIRADRLDDPAGAVEAFRNGLLADPERALGLDALEAALRRLGRQADFATTLAPVLAAAPPARRAALQCRLGNAARERADSVGALAHFRAALEADPNHARAQAGLARAAETIGDDTALFEVWSREAARCEPERLEALGRAALERALASDEPERALLVLQRWAERAATRESLEALATVLGESGHSEELPAVLDALDPHLDAVERAAHRRRLGYQHAAEGRTDLAVAAWREALGHDPRDAASYEALVGALAENGADAELVALCEARDPAAPRSPRADSLFGQALERAGRIADAARVLRALAATGAADAEAAAAFERVARASGEPAALVEALALQAVRDDASGRRALERAELLDTVLDRNAEARAAYAALEADARDETVRARAAALLDALLERTGAIPALCQRLAERVGGADGFATHLRVADLAEHRLGDRARARQHLDAALALDPCQPLLWRRLAALAEDAATRLRALEGELSTEPERDRSLALVLAIGRLACEELGDAPRAADAYRAALRLDPSEPEANEFVGALLEREERHAELAALLRARLAASPRDAAFAPLQLRLAALLTGHLGRPEEAIEVLSAARDAAGPIAAIAEPLAFVLTRLGRHEECAEVCEAAALESLEPAVAGDFWARAASAHAALDADARAAHCLRRALDVGPDSRERRASLVALSRRLGDDAGLVALLERELEEPGADVLALRCELTLRCAALGHADRAADHALAAAAIVPFDASLREPALERAAALGRSDAVAALLRAAATDPRSEHRAALWVRHAECLAARDPESAAVSFAQSLAIEPAQPAVREARRALLERLGRADEALVELEAEIERAPAAERALRIAHGADLALRAHGAPDAIPWLGRLVAEAPDDAETWIGIAHRYRLAGVPEAEERALREAERRTARPADAAALARERAALLEGPLGDAGRALAAWQLAQERAPGDPDTLAALDRLYTRTGRLREALDILEARAARASGAARSALLERAALGAEALGEASRAAALWRAALENPARRSGLLARAVDAQRRARELDAFLALGEEELQGPCDAARARMLHRALAPAWRDERARPDRALAHLRALANSGDAADRAALFAALRAAGAHAELATHLADHLRDQPDDRASWLELAMLRENTLWDASGAAEAWRALARLEPDSAPAVAGLRRASQRAGDARALDAAIEREIELGAVDAAAAWRRLGRLRREVLRDLAGAERAYTAAFDLDAGNLETLAALRELAEARGDWTRALDVGARELERVDADDIRRQQSLWLHRAERAAGAARDLACAAAAFEQADALGALPAATLAAWAGLLRETGPASRWREVFARACDHPDAKADARDHLALAQALADAGLADPAASRLRAVLALAPDHAGAWALAARLREAAGDAEGSCDAWSRAAQASTGLDAARAWRAAAAPFEIADPSRALSLLERAAEVFPSFAPAHAARALAAERLGRFEEAVAAAKAALDARGVVAPLLRDEHRDTARAGARAAYAIGRWSEAWQLGSEALALAPGDPDALLAQGVAAQHLGSPTAARRALEAWLASEPPAAERAPVLAVLGDALAELGEREAALAHYGDALALAPLLDAAHASTCALLELLERPDEAAEAFARWAAWSGARERADRLVRAARLVGSTVPRAGIWLRGAIEAAPDHAGAWLEWLAHLAVNGTEDERLAAAVAGAAQVSEPHVAAQLEIERARILEARGDETGARGAYVRAVELDASQVEAAWAGARLLRSCGDWDSAAACLGTAAERHPDPDVRASLFAERGRLCAGPLEDLPRALAAYERACALAPDRAELREALASVCAQLPGGRDRAEAELRTVVALDPVRPTAWRRLAHVLREAGREREAARGMALLRAIGAATSAERESAPARLGFAIGAARLGDPLGESLREAFLAIAGDWAQALGESEAIAAKALDPAVARMSEAWRAASAETVGQALAELDVVEFAAQAEALVWTALGAAATIEARPEIRTFVDRVPGRALRRLRRGLGGIDTAALRRLDFVAWTHALRALSLARAVDRNEGDLRTALGCARADVMRVDGAPLPDEADLTPFAASLGTAQGVVSHAVRAWLATLGSAASGLGASAE